MTTNIKLAGQVAKHVELRSITLKSANVDSFFLPDEVPEEVAVSQQHRCSYVEKEREGIREIHVLAEFKFNASRGDAEDGPLVKMAATFVLVYSVAKDAEFEPRCLRYFTDVNGAYNAWPYWREVVQSVTGRVGLAGVLVPVYLPRPEEVAEEVVPSSQSEMGAGRADA